MLAIYQDQISNLLYRGVNKVDWGNSMNRLVASLLLLFVTELAYSAMLTGTIADSEDKPLAGALITLSSLDNMVSETVYSGLDGSFILKTSMLGRCRLRIRAPSYEDKTKNITVKKGSHLKISQKLDKLIEPLAISKDLTSSAHAARINFDSEELRLSFRSQCHFCHQIGNEFTRKEKSASQWNDAITRMESYGVLITDEEVDVFTKELTTAFDGTPLITTQSWDYSTDLSNAMFKEWRIGDSMSYVHDIEIGEDGLLYGVDMGNDKIYVINPHTNQSQTIELPASNQPLGGMFSGALAPLGTFNSRHGPHSIQAGPKGKLWTTNSLASETMSFDPGTGSFELYPIGEDSIYPHTLRFDKEGILWFTLALSNQIGKFDPQSETFTLIDTPSNGVWRKVSDVLMPTILKIAAWFPKQDLHLALSHHKVTQEGYQVLNLPYGIDINPIDGSIWYSKLYSNYIGRLDPKTLEIQEFKTPLKGPRRLRFSKDGTLWIPSFVESGLMRFDTNTSTFEIIDMPTLAPNEYEAPYALNVHPTTGDIWITSNLSDRVFRYIPMQKRFVSYPSPTKVTFLRDIVFDANGGVCSSNANLPAYAIEGGLQAMLCIYPDKNALPEYHEEDQ